MICTKSNNHLIPFNLLSVSESYYNRNKEKVKDSSLQSKYGISLEEYQELYESQNGRCAICYTTKLDKRKRSFCVDHRHSDGKVRGLLCGRCNRAIGLLNDSPILLERAVRYIRATL